MTANLGQFTRDLDRLLGLAPSRPADSPVIQIASMLAGMELDADAAPQLELRARWVSRTRAVSSHRSFSNLVTVKWAFAATLTILLALLIVFRQPVFAAVGRLFGYIYVQDTGFLPADSTLVLAQPVAQEHDGRTLLALHGVATSQETTLYLEYSDIASPADGAQLELANGEILPLTGWEYNPNMPDSHGVRLTFPVLPNGASQITLLLPEGWHLPLSWIPASVSALPDVQVIPYPEAGESASTQPDLCVEKNGMKLCVLAATTSPESTSVLVESKPLNPDLRPSWMGTVWQAEPITLQYEQGEVLQMQEARAGMLIFPPLPAAHQVTLTIPAVLADVSFPEQNLVVDVGSDPQPNTVIPLDATIQVLNMSVHFSQATFTGDGVNSLRLTLNADSVQTVDGLTPASLEIGKPDRIDDLYGSGMLMGSKDIFIELVQPQGKINGTITIPVIGASVIVDGLFEFTFTLPEATSIAPTPVIADPNTYSPAPTPTPLPLDRYVYTGEPLQSGDLLFTAINGSNTDVYIFTPNVDAQPRLLATLPGATSQLYVHSDRQGLDYLAGSAEFRDGFSYIDNIRLYTLRFSEGKPRLLYNFTPNPINTIGTTITVDWSFDGKYLAFRSTNSVEPGYPSQYGWIDLVCREGNPCETHEIPTRQELELSAPIFAPKDYRILFMGADYADVGGMALFLLDFDPNGSNDGIEQITPNYLLSDTSFSASWMSDSKVLAICGDWDSPELDVFCTINLEKREVSVYEPIQPNLQGYRLYNFWQLSPTGNRLAALVFPESSLDEPLPQLRLLDLDGNLGSKIAESQGILIVAFSPSGEWLAYATNEGARLYVADVHTGDSILVQEFAPHAISWLGWVR